MRIRWIVGGLVVASGIGFAAGRAFTDDGAEGGGMPDPAEMEKAWAPLREVRAEHKRLAALAGTWDLEMNSPKPDGTEEKSTGTATFTSLFGGRFVRQDVKSTMNGEPFEGTGYLGFENATGKFISFWMDSMSTGWMTGTGVAKGDKAVEYQDVMHGPGGNDFKTRDVVTFVNDKEFTFEMYGSFVPGKPEMKMFTIRYTKK